MPFSHTRFKYIRPQNPNAPQIISAPWLEAFFRSLNYKCIGGEAYQYRVKQNQKHVNRVTFSIWFARGEKLVRMEGPLSQMAPIIRLWYITKSFQPRISQISFFKPSKRCRNFYNFQHGHTVRPTDAYSGRIMGGLLRYCRRVHETSLQDWSWWCLTHSSSCSTGVYFVTN